MYRNSLNNRVSAAILEADRLGDLFDDLGLDFTDDKAKYRGRCPVHGGGDKNFELKTYGDVVPVNWRCHSHNCHHIYKPSLLGLVRGVLTFQQHGTLVDNLSKAVSIRVAADYLKRFADRLPPGARRARPAAREKPKSNLLHLTRAQVRERLHIPSPYFVARGFSPAVLDAMDVGHSPRLGRSAVPLYDDAGEICIGFTARWEGPECDKCGLYHSAAQPCGGTERKWRLLDGFPKSTHLYNYAAALRSAAAWVLLVEGPGDVWRAAEAGVLALACLGNDLSARQAELLAALRKGVAVAFDDDIPGDYGARAALSLLHRTRIPAIPLPVPSRYHDVGEMPPDVLTEWSRLAGRALPRGT